MQLQERVSYSILSDKSPILGDIVSNYIQLLNYERGISVGPDMLRDYVIVSDDATPREGVYIISRIERTGFILLDLDSHPLGVMRGLFKGMPEAYFSFLKTSVCGRYDFKPGHLYFYMLLLLDCVKESTFDRVKAERLVVNYKIRSGGSPLDVYRVLNNFILNSNKGNLTELYKVLSVSRSPLGRLSDCLCNVLRGTVPTYISSRVSYSESSSVVKDYLTFSSKVSLAGSFDELILDLTSNIYE